ncbi:MAG: hypothetical protein L6Q71_09730, partial [Planctomycetes bacterium]|nr:hypothetical protein [Planctomycetota bacterium]
MNLVSQILFLVFVVILVACGDAASVTDHHLVDSASHLNDEPIEKNEKPATVVETIKLEGMTTPVASADGKVQTIHYGLTIDFESPQKPPALWKTGGGSNVLRAFADDVMKKFQFEQIQDADFEARYCADLKDFLNLHIVTKALRVEMTELR